MLEREKKARLVKEYREKFGRAEALFLAGYQGIKANEMTELRRTLRDAGVEFRILKNTVARLAVKDTPGEVLSGHFKGPVAVALSYRDSNLAANKLTRFASGLPNFKIRAGMLGGKLLRFEDIENLSKLPAREVMIAMLIGIIKNQPASFVVVLGGVLRKFVYALAAVKSAKEGVSK